MHDDIIISEPKEAKESICAPTIWAAPCQLRQPEDTGQLTLKGAPNLNTMSSKCPLAPMNVIFFF